MYQTRNGCSIKKGHKKSTPSGVVPMRFSAVAHRHLGIIEQVFQISKDSIQFHHCYHAPFLVYEPYYSETRAEIQGGFRKLCVKSLYDPPA